MQMHRDQDDHHAEDGHARVREHGKPHVGKACKAQQHDADLDGKCEDDAEFRRFAHALRNIECREHCLRIRAEEHHIRGFHRRIRTAAHCRAHIRTGEHRCIVDAVSDEQDSAVSIAYFCHSFGLFGREKSRMKLLDADGFRRAPAVGFTVTREHDRIEPTLLHGGDCLRRVGLHRVGEHQIAEILPVLRRIDDRACGMLCRNRNPEHRHELLVAACGSLPVQLACDALAGDFLHVLCLRGGNPALRCGCQDAPRNRMRGDSFQRRRQLQDFLTALHCGDGETALGERAGLIHDNRLHALQRFERLTVLEQDALRRAGADAGEERQRDAQHQRTRARDHQEIECRVDPVTPFPREQGRDDCRQQGNAADDGRVDTRKPCDEPVNFRLACRRILHAVEDALHHGMFQRRSDLKLQHAALVDAAGHDRIALVDRHRNRFAGHGCRIDGAVALEDDAVHRDAVARTHENPVTGLDVLRRDDFRAAVLRAELHGLGAHVDRVHDGFPAALHGDMLEQLTEPEEQHDACCLLPAADADRTERCHCHEEVFVKDLPLSDAFQRIRKHLPAQQPVGGQQENGGENGGLYLYNMQQQSDEKQHAANDECDRLGIPLAGCLAMTVRMGMLAVLRCILLLGGALPAGNLMPVVTDMRMWVMCLLFAEDDPLLHGIGSLADALKQPLSAGCGDVQESLRIGQACLFDALQILDGSLDLCRTVRAVEIFYKIDRFHRYAPFPSVTLGYESGYQF